VPRVRRHAARPAFYEDKGLLAAERPGREPRLLGADRARLQLILRGKRVGFSLAAIAEMLALYDREDGGAAQMALSLGKFRDRLDDLRRQREDLDKAITELETGCGWLEEQLAQMRPDFCPRPPTTIVSSAPA
jgi:DNA-binding transcriptional MerR regulator